MKIFSLLFTFALVIAACVSPQTFAFPKTKPASVSSKDAQNSLREAFASSSESGKDAFTRNGKLTKPVDGSEPADCNISVGGMSLVGPDSSLISEDETVFMLNLTIPGQSSIDDKTLTFNLDERSEPRMLVKAPNQLILEQTDIHSMTKYYDVQTATGVFSGEDTGDRGTRNTLEVDSENGKVSSITVFYGSERATCKLTP